MPKRRLKPGPKKTTLRGKPHGTDTYDHTENSKEAQAYVMDAYPSLTKAKLTRMAWSRWAQWLKSERSGA